MVSLPLVSLADVTAHLPVRSGDSSYDDRINLLIATATQQIEAATNRRFASQAHTQFFRTHSTAESRYDFYGTGNESGAYTFAREKRYVLRGFPVTVTEQTPFRVFYDPCRVYGDDTEVDPADYVLDADTGVLALRLATTEGTNFLKVTYTAGYAADDPDTPTYLVDVPVDLKLACITQTLHLFTRTTTDNIGVDLADRSSKTTVEARFTSRGGLTPEAAALVSRYRQPLLGLG